MSSENIDAVVPAGQQHHSSQNNRQDSNGASKSRQSLYVSMGCMMSIAAYLTYHELLQLQTCGKKLYTDIVPRVMMNRQLLPQIAIHHFLQGVEYDPQLIRDAMRQVSMKNFVPNQWPTQKSKPDHRSKTRTSIPTSSWLLGCLQIQSDVRQPKAKGTDLEQEPHANLGHYEGQMTRIRGHLYPHGRGTLLANIEHVRGTQQFVEREGQHDSYIGQFKYGKKHGVGRAIFQNGTIYQGLWYDDDPRGSGILVKEDVMYIGEFFEGKFQGQGTMYYLDAGIEDANYVAYQGHWYAGLKHGQGLRITFKETTVLEEEEYEDDSVDQNVEQLNSEQQIVEDDQNQMLSSFKDESPSPSPSQQEASILGPPAENYGHWQPMKQVDMLKSDLEAMSANPGDYNALASFVGSEDESQIISVDKGTTKKKTRKVEKQKILRSETKQKWNFGKHMQ